MIRLNNLCSCGRHRWICSAVCTLALCALIVALPVWDFHVQAEVAEDFSENAVSVVTVTQKRRIKTVEKKIARPAAPKTETIPPIPQERKEDTHEEDTTEPEERTEIAETETTDAEKDAEENGESASAQEAPVPDVSEEAQKVTATYKSYALSRIASKKTYPYAARSQGLEGNVRVHVVIQSDGTVSESEIVRPCEHAILNDACLAAVKKAAPFKKMPRGMSAVTLTFVMDFSLK